MAYTAQDWSLGGLAVELAMDRRTVGKKIGNLEPVRITGRAKFYLMADVVRTLMGYKGESGEADALDLSTERARLAKEQADKTGMENKRLRRDIFTGAELARPIDKMISDCRLSLLAIPTKAAPHVLGCKTVAEAEGVLKTYVHESLNDLKSRDPHSYLAGCEDEAVGAAAKPDDKPVGRPVQKVKSGKQRGAGAVADK